jgi:hypothetical protein
VDDGNESDESAF